MFNTYTSSVPNADDIEAFQLSPENVSHALEVIGDKATDTNPFDDEVRPIPMWVQTSRTVRGWLAVFYGEWITRNKGHNYAPVGNDLFRRVYDVPFGYGQAYGVK